MIEKTKLKNILMGQGIILVISVILFLIYMLFTNFNYEVTSINRLLILTTTGLCIVLLLGIYFLFNKFDIFDPLLIISVIYLLIFYIAPLIWLINGDEYYYGVNVMSGLIKGSLYFILGYFFLWGGYLFSPLFFVNKNQNNIKQLETNIEYMDKRSLIRNKIVRVSIIMYIIFSMLGVFYFLSMGKGLVYIFTLGQSNPGDDLGDSSFEFMTNFITALIPVILILFGFMKRNKWILVPMTMFIFLLMLVSGSRYRIFILILAFVIFWYLKKNKRPKVFSVTLIGLILLIINGIVAIQRGSIRGGNELVSNITFLDILNEVMPNINVFFPFYRVVEAFPTYHDFYYVQGTMFYTLFYAIPRFVWPDKPSPVIWETISVSMNDYSRNAGVAYPNIGEYYVDFGVFGIVIFMFLFGLLSGYIKTLSKHSSLISMISFSVLLPSMLQLVSRGYLPQNAFMIISLIFPILIVKRIEKKYIKKILRRQRKES